jgi:hypothetical protein
MGRYRPKADRTALGLIALLVVGVGAAIGFVVWLTGGPSPYDGVDPSTYCRINGPRSVTVVLIDATDTLTPQQNERLLVELKKLRDTLPRFDRIVLAAIDSSEAAGARTLVEACNPGTVEDDFREARRLVEKAYSELFDAPFQTALASVLAGASADHSPIIEAIEQITVQAFGPLPDSAPVRKRLIVVSDMLQNTTALSFYKSVPEFPGFKGSDQFRLHRPALGNVEIVVWEINRPSGTGISRQKIVEFWQQYFAAQGGVLSRTSAFWDATKI